MSNDIQQMPCQILDLGLQFYLKTLDLQIILCKKKFDGKSDLAWI